MRLATIGRTLGAGALATLLAAGAAADGALDVDADDFGCISEMTPVRGFYVGNLLGDLDATLAVARSEDGGTYPPGSVVQLVPTEAMVKHPEGYNAATRDWEFFELDPSPEGSAIRVRGFADVVTRFGGNCFACHVKAEPKWDMICETGHGCDPIPLTADMTRVLQKADPRCDTSKALTPEDIELLKALGAAG
ncbi:MAG: hypothetical protein CMD39_10630 [Gammaproteobacteria bacterium]|nr:hypothetical protein [Gammaproteobacteria bacterium]